MNVTTLVIDSGASATASNNIVQANGYINIGGSSGMTGWKNNTAFTSTAAWGGRIFFQGIQPAETSRKAATAGMQALWTAYATTATADTDYGLTFQQWIPQIAGATVITNVNPITRSLTYHTPATGSQTQTLIRNAIVSGLSTGWGQFQFTVSNYTTGSNAGLQIQANSGFENLLVTGDTSWTITNVIAGIQRVGYGSDLTYEYGITCTPTNYYSLWQFDFDTKVPTASPLAQDGTKQRLLLFWNEADTNFSTFATALGNLLAGGTLASGTTANYQDDAK